MGESKQKIFKDSLHGYISIDEEWCREFIDTSIFQRLRHVEQTSMRCLFPSARHDRFVHSLGVYHLGTKAFDSFDRNAADWFNDLPAGERQRLRVSFLAGCLLHDCAHAPFSHTFERFFDSGGQLDTDLKREMSADPAFQTDFSYASPQPHEKASALAVLLHFKEAIQKFGGDAQLAARMILGCTFRGTQDLRLQLSNVLISLLNGRAIDVDKLDYIARDTWASGISNTSIDIPRLLAAVTAARPTPHSPIRVAFRKTALSVLQGVVDARNYLYAWIYSHHKVCYNEYLLQKAGEHLRQRLGSSQFDSLFSVSALSMPVSIGNISMFLPTDGDLMCLLKSDLAANSWASEWLSREHRQRALWKTRAEFLDWFEHHMPGRDLPLIADRLLDGDRLNNWWKSEGLDGDPLILKVSPKISEIYHNEVFIALDKDRVVSYSSVFAPARKDTDYFYLYASSDATVDRGRLTDFIASLF